MIVGQVFGHYRIAEKIGCGGMGDVYRADDEKLHRQVAIKLLRADDVNDDAGRNQIVGEARTASSLNHPNICTIYEVGESDGEVYIVMEYVKGMELQQLAHAGLGPDAIIRYGIQIADALAHAHAHGVIHRDLKTSNILITPEGRAKLLDFGLARRSEAEDFGANTQSQLSDTGVSNTSGTLPYIAPEILQGNPADARTDLWAFGVVLYEMAAGQLPFKGRTGYELTSSILTGQPEPLPARIPEGLALVIEHCLIKEPERASKTRKNNWITRPELALRTASLSASP